MATQAQTTQPAAEVIKPRQSALTRRNIQAAWIFLTPMLVVLAFVAAWPLLRTIYFSFTDASLSSVGTGDYGFVGFNNFLEWFDYGDGTGEWFGLLADPDWGNAVWNTVWFTLVTVTIETVLGLIVALVLNAKFPGRAFIRAAILVPWAVPTIVSAKMWAWMMNDQFGILNDLLSACTSSRPRSPGRQTPTRRFGPSSSSTSGRRPPSWRC